MPHCVEAASPALENRDSPTRDTVGTMVRGDTTFSITPTIPEQTTVRVTKALEEEVHKYIVYPVQFLH